MPTPQPFEPIRTERLIIRRPIPSDADAAYERRSLPEVGRYQDWEMPYTRERAERSTAACAAMDGPVNDSTWNITVVDAEHPDRILGDLALELRWGGRVGYIGYTFHPDYWGRGYATEASEALVRYLFMERGVTRIESSLHPDNPASARVLEACGLTFEGLTRESFWVGDECSSDMLYGMTRADWEEWRDRPRHRPAVIRLVPITAHNSIAVGALITHKSQERFVPTMLENFRDTLVPPIPDGDSVRAWAIDADGVVVGFLLVQETASTDRRPRLLRMLIDRIHQRRGIGSAALDLVEQHLREHGAKELETTWTEGPGSPARFFVSRGYEPILNREDGAVHARKRLTP